MIAPYLPWCMPLVTIKKVSTILLHKPAQNSLNHNFMGQSSSQNIIISNFNEGSIEKIVPRGERMLFSTCNCITISHLWVMLGTTLPFKSVNFYHKIEMFPRPNDICLPIERRITVRRKKQQ